jgi:hypothetical protein
MQFETQLFQHYFWFRDVFFVRAGDALHRCIMPRTLFLTRHVGWPDAGHAFAFVRAVTPKFTFGLSAMRWRMFFYSCNFLL